MTQEHPITPPNELVEQWYDAIDNSSTAWKQKLATPMNSSQRAITALIFLVPVLVIALAVWWIPQKWQACEKLYSNLPAKIICLNSGS